MTKVIKPEADVVVCGLGWAGSLMCIELAMAGLTVRALDRGQSASGAPLRQVPAWVVQLATFILSATGLEQ